MTWLMALASVAVAWVGGAAIVAWLWPTDEDLSLAAWLGLSGLLGPFAVGLALFAGGLCGVPGRWTAAVVGVAALASGVWGLRSRGSAALAQEVAGGTRRVLLWVVLVTSITGTSWIASRTHLGWDGTVLWLHKARAIAASDGVLPLGTLKDPTRVRFAPDYPLQVPLATAWVLTWMPEEDERVVKVMPAAWCAALLLLVAGAIADGRSRGGELAAACGLALLALNPRLLVGEGSFTSGYGDLPEAGLLLALVWLAVRSRWGAFGRWSPVMAIVAAALVWTKQEGTLATLLVVALMSLSQSGVSQPSLARRLTVVLPAAALSTGWLIYLHAAGVPRGLAFVWPGVDALPARLISVLGVLGGELGNLQAWGLFWPGILTALLSRPSAGLKPLVVVGGVVAGGVGALVFSSWTDVAEHARVTLPRQLIHVAPTLVFVAFGSLAGGKCHPQGRQESPQDRTKLDQKLVANVEIRAQVTENTVFNETQP